MENILDKAKRIEDQIVRWRRDIHRTPEVGNDLPKTSMYVQNRLKEMGIPFSTMVGGSAVVGLIEGSQKGKTVGLRADMDALPIVEDTDFEFKSTNGNMHACGHDSHTAMLLGAAEILNKEKEQLKGNVKLIFQPGEETPGGAKLMIEEGVLENPKVDAIFGQHVGVLFDNSKSGQIFFSKGKSMACRDNFKITIKGRGAHGSMPQTSIDPIAISAQIINGIYMIKAREIDALSPAVISVCMIHGGSASNIIPQEVTMEGSTRSIDPSVQTLIATRIEDVVRCTCETYGASYDFDFIYDYPITINDPEMAELFFRSAQKIVDKNDIIEQTRPLMGSEDMSFFLQKVPGAYYFLASVLEQNGIVYQHHNPRFALDESVFATGTALLCQVAVDYLNS